MYSKFKNPEKPRGVNFSPVFPRSPGKNIFRGFAIPSVSLSQVGRNDQKSREKRRNIIIRFIHQLGWDSFLG